MLASFVILWVLYKTIQHQFNKTLLFIVLYAHLVLMLFISYKMLLTAGLIHLYLHIKEVICFPFITLSFSAQVGSSEGNDP